MSLILMDLMGDHSRSDDPRDIDALLTQLDVADKEHTDVAVRTPDGWTISAYRSGNVVFENIEARSSVPRHIKRLPRSEISRLMRLLAAGDLAALEREPWEPGYPRA
jgi:hypothetical protein